MEDGKVDDTVAACWSAPNLMEVLVARGVLSIVRPIATRRMITSGLMHCSGPISVTSSSRMQCERKGKRGGGGRTAILWQSTRF